MNWRINKILYLQPQKHMVVVVQLVRTPDCGSGGRGFKSHHPPYKNLASDLSGAFLFGFALFEDGG